MTEPEKKAAPRARRRTEGEVVGFKPAAPAAGARPKVAITGGSGYLGARFVRALAARGTWDIVVLDLAPAANTPVDVRHRFLDLNLPHSDGTVYKILKEERPDVLVHLAGVRSPLRDAVYAHELNSIGTLNVFGAAGEAEVKRLIHYSTTMVYGARGDNPAFLSEEHLMRADVADHFVRDSVEAERHCRDFARRHPEARVAVLRFAPLLAAERRDYRIRYLEGPVALTMLGYDPLLQWLHPDDASEALLRALDTPGAHGVFNIAPDGVLPLSSTLLLFGTPSIPLPHSARVRRGGGGLDLRPRYRARGARALHPLPVRRGQREGAQGPRVRSAGRRLSRRPSRPPGRAGAPAARSTSTCSKRWRGPRPTGSSSE